MRRKILTFSLVLAFLLGQMGPALADQSFWGGALGAGLGGLLGSQFGRGTGQLAATGLGVAAGAMVGSNVGASMDRADRMYPGTSYGYSAPVLYQQPVYQPTYVAPPDPPVRVVYVQQPVYVTGGYVGAPEARECREFTQTTRIGNEYRKTQGLACLQPDGSWQIQ